MCFRGIYFPKWALCVAEIDLSKSPYDFSLVKEGFSTCAAGLALRPTKAWEPGSAHVAAESYLTSFTFCSTQDPSLHQFFNERAGHIERHTRIVMDQRAIV